MKKKGAQKGGPLAGGEAARQEASKEVTPPARRPVARPEVPRTSLPRPEELVRPVAPAGRGGPREAAPLLETEVGDEPEHRHFPRARLARRFEIWREEGGERRFSATLLSQNVSVSGAFLESTFFLPMGTELNVRFSLEDGAEPVLARAEIVREERAGGPGGRTGFGLRFVEFSGQTEVSLARLFLGMRLRAFAEEYMQSRRARALPNELERVVDVLAAWELLKATSPGDPWRGR